MEGSLLIVAEKATLKKVAYLNTLEYCGLKWKKGHTAPGNLANDYGAYQGSMSNHDKIYRTAEVKSKSFPTNSTGQRA